MKNRKHILKISSIFLTAAMLLSSMGAAAFAAEKTPAGTIDKLATNGSSFLSSSDKAGALEAVRDGVLNYQSNIDIKDYRIKADDAGLLLDAVKSCYPETFCLAQTVYVSPTQIGGVSYISSVIPQYQTSSAEEYNTMLSAFYAKADEYLSLVDDSMNDFTKAVVLHDAIVMNSEYYITKDGVSATPYTLMVEGWGKCEDYSRVYAYLLAQTGIKSELVDSDSMNHEWIKIQLEGKYYEVDVTWDDPVSSKDKLDSPGRVSHDYFLFSNSSFPNHSGYYELNPSADTTYDEYYIHNMDSQLCMVRGSLYGIYCASGVVETKLVSYNAANELTTVYDLGAAVESAEGFWASHWSAGGGYYYTRSYANLCTYDGLLYYNMPKGVYVFDAATNTNLKLAAYNGTNPLYGLKIADGKLYGDDAQEPGYSGTLVEVADCLKMGDVEDDGILNIIDATRIQRKLADFISFDDFGNLKADFNHDGIINISDVTAIQVAIAQ